MSNVPKDVTHRALTRKKKRSSGEERAAAASAEEWCLSSAYTL